jgi:hypothetical protein
MQPLELMAALANPSLGIPSWAIVSELNDRAVQAQNDQIAARQRAMAAAREQGTGTVTDSVLQKAAPLLRQPPVQMARHGGAMHSYNRGGIVAFQNGGDAWRNKLIAAGVPESFIRSEEARGLLPQEIETNARRAGLLLAQTSPVAPQINIPKPEEREQEVNERLKGAFKNVTQRIKDEVETARAASASGLSVNQRLAEAVGISPPVPKDATFANPPEAPKTVVPAAPPVAAKDPTGIAGQDRISTDAQNARDIEAAKIRVGELRTADKAKAKLVEIDKAIADAKASKERGATEVVSMLQRERLLTQSALAMLESGDPIDLRGIGDKPKLFEPAIDPDALARARAEDEARRASAPQRQDLGGGSADLATTFGGVMPSRSVSGVPGLIEDYTKTLGARSAAIGRLSKAEQGLDALARQQIAQEEKFGKESLAETRRAAQEAIERSQRFGTREWLDVLASIDPRRGYELSSAGKGAATALGRQEQAREAARKELAAVSKDERGLQSKLTEMNMALQKAEIEREKGNIKRAEELEDKAMALKLEAEKYRDKLKLDQRELDVKELQAGKMNDIEFYLKHGADAYARYKTAGQKPVVPLTYESASEAADKFLGTLPGNNYVTQRREDAKKAGQPVPDEVQIRQELVQRFLRDAGAPAGEAPATLPPEAVKQLKPGVATKFENGQVWTIENGVPKRVK